MCEMFYVRTATKRYEKPLISSQSLLIIIRLNMDPVVMVAHICEDLHLMAEEPSRPNCRLQCRRKGVGDRSKRCPVD